MDKKYLFTLILAGIILSIFFVKLLNKKENSSEWQYFTNEGVTFGTTYSIKYRSLTDLHDSIFQELLSLDSTFSTFNEHSLISRVNQNDTTAVLNDWFITVITKAQEISVATEGAFDITVAPLVNCWGFGFEKSDRVDQHLIDSLLAFTGYQKIRLEGNKLRKNDNRIKLDASAIAKGFACDVIANLLEKNNITDYLVEIGGEMKAKGRNSTGNFWLVGILKPIESKEHTAEIQQKIHLYEKALATSGNYRNFYYTDGQKRAHTIDPHSGYPVIHSVLSASVIAADCMTADACATAFMVMGLEKATSFLAHHPELDACLIFADENGNNHVFFTENFGQKFADE
jgi:thiamine biosynthesis lipoprotein